ncbi:MAG: hypothetical protein GWP03_06300 [Proteobacteria bacterium]|nr:hypothetical protein [Pseudomonadota bacterium]
MKISNRVVQGTVVISIYGVIKRKDIEILLNKLHSYLEKGYRYFIIDLRHTRHSHYILGYRLSDFKRRVDSLGGRLSLVIASRYIIQILRLSGNDWTYSMSHTQKQALNGILKFRRGNA